MKNAIIFLLLLALSGTGTAQKSYEIPKRLTPTVKEQTIANAQSINDLSPLLWQNLNLTSAERYWLTARRVNEAGPVADGYQYPQDKYSEVLDVVFTEITATVNGKTATAQANSDKLTAEQKTLLASATPGSDITIKLRYMYKDKRKDAYGKRDYAVQGDTKLTILPQVEAQFPGGKDELNTWFADKVIYKLPEVSLKERVERAIIKFTIAEDGKVLEPRLERSSGDEAIDQLLMQALYSMPQWQPAVNSKGVRIKQEVLIPFGFEGC
ncbi:MAG: energy transducer TonB [Chitinophagales bacterium]